MTDSQLELLAYFLTRAGVVPVQPERRNDLVELHKLGFVATHGDFACITDEGRVALRDQQEVQETLDELH